MRSLVSHINIARSIALIIMAALVFFSLALAPRPALAAQEDAKAIAVVYDDSSSMFQGTRWCKAKYSLEVLAGMIGDQDKMRVFPLNSEVFDVTADTPQDRVDQVHKAQIYNVKSTWTPGGPVKQAYEWLANENADASGCYLVIATDGGFNEKKEVADQAVLDALDDHITVVFMRIGSDGDFVESVSDPLLFKFEANDNEDNDAILDAMIDVSQMIFGRHELDVQNFNQDSGKLTLPVSSTKLIVFAQGGATSVGSLQRANVSSTNLSASVSYSDMPSDEYVTQVKKEYDGKAPQQDTSLNGEIVTYTVSDGSSLPSGEYELSVQADAVNIYYEPDVSIKATFTDADGNERFLTEAGDDNFLVPGEYRVNLTLIDNVTGEDVSSVFGLDNAELVIDDSSAGGKKTYLNGDAVVLAPGASSGRATCEVVDDLVVTTEYNNIEVFENNLELSVAQIELEDKKAVTMANVEEMQLDITVTKNGELLSADEWVAATLNLTEQSGNVEWTWEQSSDVSKYVATAHWRGGFLGQLAADLFGYNGFVTTDSYLRSGMNRGYATNSTSYYIAPNWVKAAIDLIPLWVLLAILFLVLSRGYVKPFTKANIAAQQDIDEAEPFEFPGTAIERKRDNVSKIKDFAKSIIPGLNRAHVELRCIGLEGVELGNPVIKLTGAYFRLGRKVRFVNWESWENEGWRLTPAVSGDKPLISRNTTLSYDGAGLDDLPLTVTITFNNR